MRAAGCAACLAFLAGCGRYADFTLPVLPSAGSVHLTFKMQPEPVIRRGSAGDWDSHDVLNPSVIQHAGQYWNFFSGFDGKTWRTGLAVSADGVSWKKRGVVLSPDPSTWEAGYIAANGTAIYQNGLFWYWYQAGVKGKPEIGLARSQDGWSWTKEPRPVVTRGPVGSFDESATADPFVLHVQDYFYMYYLGENRARLQRIGLARSRDGVRWEKLRSNPIHDLPWPGSGVFDENGDGEPAVWVARNSYWILLTGRDRSERRSLALAHSQDGVHWELESGKWSGTEPWNRSVLCDPTVLTENGITRVWFGGGDRAAPDENVNGQIGFGTLQ